MEELLRVRSNNGKRGLMYMRKMFETFIPYFEIEEATRRGDVVEPLYNDGDTVTVKYEDYNRAMGAIINAEKEDVIRDFAIK